MAAPPAGGGRGAVPTRHRRGRTGLWPVAGPPVPMPARWRQGSPPMGRRRGYRSRRAAPRRGTALSRPGLWRGAWRSLRHLLQSRAGDFCVTTMNDLIHDLLRVGQTNLAKHGQEGAMLGFDGGEIAAGAGHEVDRAIDLGERAGLVVQVGIEGFAGLAGGRGSCYCRHVSFLLVRGEAAEAGNLLFQGKFPAFSMAML